ncbi:MAG: cbb3-type cytochrome c oxidase N-terminal domain-containing protein [Ignavibacteriaceae bacterium]
MKHVIQNKKNKFLLVPIAIGMVFIAASTTFGQTKETDMIAYIDNAALIFFILVIATFLVLFLYHEKEPSKTGPSFKTLLIQLKDKLIDAAPVEKEQDILLDHDYDGIRELDNKLPPWWKYLFYVTIVFAVVYMLDYHIIGSGKLQDAEYLEEVKLAELEKANISGGKSVDENTAEILKEPADLLSGKTSFTKLCVVCHGTKGEGIVGPNLTDNYWIHGGGIKNVFTTIKNGVPEKGMVSWKSQLSPSQIEEVASYVLSLQGTNPANAKPPQGDLWTEKNDSTKAH